MQKNNHSAPPDAPAHIPSESSAGESGAGKPTAAELLVSVPGEEVGLASPAAKTPAHLMLEIAPLLAFFLGYKYLGIWEATMAIMATTAACVAVQWFLTRRIPVLTIITAVMVAVFGTLTLALHDAAFIKMKPTLIYGLFALLIGGGRWVGKNPLRTVFGQMFTLSERGWHLLSWRWVLFFMILAAGNELLWRHVSEAVWVDVKVFGFLPLTMLFALCQYPLLKHESSSN